MLQLNKLDSDAVHIVVLVAFLCLLLIVTVERIVSKSIEYCILVSYRSYISVLYFVSAIVYRYSVIHLYIC